MVLAAGLGERMRPLSLLRAKPVLPVLNRPLLHWTLERLAAAGVTEVVINLHHLPNGVRRRVGDGGAFGLRVRYSLEREILGTAGGPRKVRSFFADEPFLLVNGDALFDFDLRALAARHRRSGAQATLALRPNPDPCLYGPVVTGPDGWIRSISGWPRPARGTVSLFAGVHVLEPALLERLPAGKSDSVRDLYTPLLAEGGRLLGVRVRGAWYDLGSPSLYLAAQLALLRDGGGSVIHTDARIGRGARIVRSVLGAGAVVATAARVESSVLWERAAVAEGARVRRCVLADGARIEAGDVVNGMVVTRSGRRRL